MASGVYIEQIRHSDDPENLLCLWNTKVNYHFHMNLPLGPILSHTNPSQPISL
jgi:hypothetical protein